MESDSVQYLADMNLSPKTVEMLNGQGYRCVRVSEVLPVTAKDVEILEWARENQMVIITQDLDFSALVALRQASHPSLINIRMSTGNPERIGKRLLQVLPECSEELRAGACITFDDETVRVRSLPIQI